MEVFFNEAGDFGAVLENNIYGADEEDGSNGDAGDESGFFGGGLREEGVGGAVVIADFATAVSFWIALVAFFTGGDVGILFKGFTATGEGVAIFTGGAFFDFGDGGGFDAVAGFFVDNLPFWTGTILLEVIGFARGGTIRGEPVFRAGFGATKFGV